MRTEALHALGAALLLASAAGLAWFGQPGPTERWGFLAPELGPRLEARQVQIDPAELLGLMHNDYLDLHIIDVRNERDWNLFHLWGAQRIPTDELALHRKTFSQLPQNGVIVLVGNDEAAATDAWKLLMATASRPNAYILAGGINRWLAEFGGPDSHGPGHGEGEALDDTLRWPPAQALGSRHPAALPDPHLIEQRLLTKRVRLQKRIVKKGGCG